MASDSLSEDLLAEHEIEAQRLAEELESKGPLLLKAQEWVDLKAKEEELEAKRNGPDRFNTRGGALLQEEKMRKRIGAMKPKVGNQAPDHEVALSSLADQAERIAGSRATQLSTCLGRR